MKPSGENTPGERIDSALREFNDFENLASQDSFLTRLHPGSKFLVTIFYILTAVSFPRYEFSGLVGLILYPWILFQLADLSFSKAVRRLRFVLPLVCCVGIAGPFLERDIAFTFGGVPISYGVISLFTLMLKGVLAVLASYLLMATTSIEKICHFLRQIHVPSALVVELLLIVRYISVFLEETQRVLTAYHLRAPRQRGVAPAAWGSLLGNLLLRSMDRADRVYQSMCLRGFRGEYPLPSSPRFTVKDFLWLTLWCALFLLFRFVPLLEGLGNLVLGL